MKSILLKLTQDEFDKLFKAKDKTGLSWEKFFLYVVKGGVKDGNNNYKRN